MKPVPETGLQYPRGSTLSSRMAFLPHGLSDKVVIGFPIKQVARCGKMSGKRLFPGLWYENPNMAHPMREVARRAG
jgi:hypothetical protein